MKCNNADGKKEDDIIETHHSIHAIKIAISINVTYM
jgi:hypothetical protein